MKMDLLIGEAVASKKEEHLFPNKSWFQMRV